MKAYYAWIAALLLVAGCNTPALDNLGNIGKESDPTRFYTLRAIEQAMPEGAAAMPYTLVGVGPVMVTDYLDRSQIVIRVTDNQLELSEFDRWAGNPDKEIQRVLAANLATLLGTSRITTYPWKTAIVPEISVEVNVERFEYAYTGETWLVANWQVFTQDGRNIVAFQRSELKRASGKEYNEIAQALSELVADLSTQIASEIRKTAAPSTVR
ncbi:MAG: PqiC family protein [Alphaproteobacteria bacterium]|nr:PqiC family protein [Alphaproteobacteria bacterium]